jgi:dienelactone hydrolase
MRGPALATLAAALVMAAPAHAAAGEPDCVGPPVADPGQREADNVFCGSQRSADAQSNPAYQSAAAQVQADHGGPVAEDPFRDPAALNGHRFRWQRVSFKDPSGSPLQGMLFRPCNRTCTGRPRGLRDFAPPYPGVVIVHGGAANQEMYLWGAEALAEDGYMVLTFQIPEPDNAGGDSHYPDAKAALDYLLSTHNPRWMELDRERIGLAGHSAGGVAVSRLGQEDPRVSAIVSWDRAQSGPMPQGLKLRTPALFLTADFNCQKVPVCLPVAYDTPPDPHGPGDKDTDFQRVSAAGVDSMKVSLRAATHLDFTEFAPTPPSSRYGAIVASYYTLAWLDRYLKGSGGGFRRLTATRFDGSADLHYISGGTYDAASGRNVPARIAGQPLADRLSFHFRSAYSLDGGRARCDDMRAGCPPAPAPVARPACKRPRFRPRSVAVRNGRARVRPRVRCGGRERSVVVRIGSRYVISGQVANLRVPRGARRLRATFTVDRHRYRAAVKVLRRAG